MVRQSAPRRPSIRPAIRAALFRSCQRKSTQWKNGSLARRGKHAFASGRTSASPQALSTRWASRGCAMRMRAATSAAAATDRWRKCNDEARKRRDVEPSALLAASEFAALAGIDEADHAFAVIGPRRLAERFPFPDALLLRRFVGG